VAQVYPDFDARPGLTALSRLRHRRRTAEGVLVQFSEEARTLLEEKRVDMLGFDGEE